MSYQFFGGASESSSSVRLVFASERGAPQYRLSAEHVPEAAAVAEAFESVSERRGV
jgi:hypothetical protein